MKIRNVKKEDAADILEIYSFYVANTAVTFEITIPSLQQMEERIIDISSSYPYLVAEDDGKVVAYCYAHELNPREAYKKSVELSIYVKKDHHGRGIGKSLYAALEEALKKAGIDALYAIVTFPDEGSVAFHSRCGFSIAGKLTDCGEKFGKKWSVLYLEKHI